MLFVVKIDPKVVAGDSLQFAKDQARASAKVVEAAQSRLDEAVNAHGPDPDDWSSATVVARAEENLEERQAQHEALLLKLNWESSEKWLEADRLRREIAKAVRNTPAAFVRPWITNPNDWASIFKPRNTKPTK